MKKMFVVLKVLQDNGPLSSVELGALCSMTGSATRDHLYNLREITPKVVYVHSWRPSLGYAKGRTSQLWAAGDAEDAVQPPARQRPKKSPIHILKDDECDGHMLSELRKRSKQIQPFRHWQDVAFFGEVNHATV
jgi:hypothetical protein